MKKVSFSFTKQNSEVSEVVLTLEDRVYGEDGAVRYKGIDANGMYNDATFSVRDLEFINDYLKNLPIDLKNVPGNVKICKIISDGQGMSMVVDDIGMYINLQPDKRELNYFLNLYSFLGYYIDVYEFNNLQQQMNRRIVAPQLNNINP